MPLRVSTFSSAPTAFSHFRGLADELLIVRVPGAELDLELGEAECLEDRLGEVDAGFDLTFDLRGGAEDVGVVLGEAAHAQQAVHGARALVAVHVAELGVAHGQVAIALRRVFVDENVTRAVHRLQAVLGVVELHRRIHVVRVVELVPLMRHSSRRMMCGVKTIS